MKLRSLSVGVVILLLMLSSGRILAESLTLDSLEPHPDVLSTDNPEVEYFGVFVALLQYENVNMSLPPPPRTPLSNQRLRTFYDSLLSTPNWHEENMILLLNENATHENITEALAQMSQRVGDEDIFLFSYQGHGSQVLDQDGDEALNDVDDLYDEVICPYDTQRHETGLSNVITDDELDVLLDGIPASGMFVIIEACFSGGMLQQDADISSWKAVDIDDPGRIILTSTQANTVGLISVSELIDASFIKTYSDAIKQGEKLDKDGDLILSVEELSDFALKEYIILNSGFNFAYGVMQLTYGLAFKILCTSIDRLFSGYISRMGYDSYEEMIYSRALQIINEDGRPLQILIATMMLIFISLSNTKIGNFPTYTDDFPGNMPLIELAST